MKIDIAQMGDEISHKTINIYPEKYCIIRNGKVYCDIKYNGVIVTTEITKKDCLNILDLLKKDAR